MSSTHSNQPRVLAQRQIEQSVMRLLTAARNEEQLERRGEPRYPFFRPVSVLMDGPQRRQYSAFSREISKSGIGLLHNMPLEQGEVTLVLLGPVGEVCRFRTQIVWCRPCGEGWFVSGGRFVDIVAPAAAASD